MVVACAALIVALTGTAIAAGVANNSVGAKELGRVEQRSTTVAANLKETAWAQATARCRVGEQLLGGGAVIDDNTSLSDGDELAESGPINARAWYARAYVGSAPQTTLTATAICLKK